MEIAHPLPRSYDNWYLPEEGTPGFSNGMLPGMSTILQGIHYAQGWTIQNRLRGFVCAFALLCLIIFLHVIDFVCFDFGVFGEGGLLREWAVKKERHREKGKKETPETKTQRKN